MEMDITSVLPSRIRARARQFLVAILICIPPMANGMMSAWVSPAALVLRSDQSPRGIPYSEEDVSWVAAVNSITAIPGAILYGYLLEKRGRREANLFLSIPFIVCWLIKLWSSRVWALIMARGIAGIASGGIIVVVPVYVKEISESSIRGTLVSMMVLFFYLGILLAYVLGAFVKYYAVLWISLTVPLVHVIFIHKVPESPEYLIKIGKIELATKVLAWLRNSSRNDEALCNEVQTMKNDSENSVNQPKITLKALIKNRTTRRALLIGAGLVTAQELSGAIAVQTYQGTIFQKALDDLGNEAQRFTPNLQAVFVGCVQLAGSMVASTVIEKLGRKRLLSATCFVVCACMSGLGAWFWLVKLGTYTPGWLPVALMSLAVFAWGAGFVPTPFVILSELFDFQSRGTVQTAVICYDWILVFIVIRTFSPLASAVGVYGVFWMFSGISFISLVCIIAFVPETKGKTVEEIYANFVKKPSNS